jgi:hypothetical protein
MTESSLSKNQRVITYLIDQLGRRIEGRTKLMKLMFLIEHCNPDSKELTTKGLLGNKFIIYHYGVFSREVMDDYIQLSNEDLVEDYNGEYPIRLLKKSQPDLDDETKSRVDFIINEFGDYEGSILVDYTLKLIGLTRETKMEHFEESVIPLIEDDGHKRFSLRFS